MRVAFFLPSLVGGGAERFAVNLSTGLTERGIHVDMVLASAFGKYFDSLSPQVRVFDLHAKRVLTSLPKLRLYLRREEPDILISAMNHANLIALWAKALAGVQTSVIVTIHNDLNYRLHNNSRFKDKVIIRLLRFFYPQAAKILTVSAGAAKSAASITKLSIDYVYNPVVTPDLFQKAQVPIDHAWFAEDHLPIILGVGRLDPNKDFETLIRAFSIVRLSYPAKLLILGDGPEHSRLVSLITDLQLNEVAQLTGFVENPFPYMAHANLFVLSSKSEALPTVLIEAMACGCPVVSTDCPSGPAEILEHGKYGRLVPVSDPPALANAMLETLNHPLPSATLREGANRFSLDTITEAYLTLMHSILEAP